MATVDFDKEEFALLLKAAKGKRSINKYGIDSGVDPGYISRLLRCLVNSPPSATVIYKLADKAHNGIRSEDLMIAAGYLLSPDVAFEMITDTVDLYMRHGAIDEKLKKVIDVYSNLNDKKKKMVDDLIDILNSDQ